MSALSPAVPARLCDALDMGALLIAADGRIRLCNRWLRERLRLHAAPDGATLTEVLGGDLHPRLQAAVQAALTRGHSSRLSTALHPWPLPLHDPGGRGPRIRHAVDVVSVPLGDGSRSCLLQVRDMGESHRREETLRLQARRLELALAEKETLLREVYHRVKNNLQVIQSLLNLKRASLDDAAARAALAETAERVRAMALVHEKLYQSSQLVQVDLADYLADLCRQVGEALRGPQAAVQLQVQAAAVRADLNCAIPFGLIVTELLSNCHKHAFADGRPGRIDVRLSPLPDGGALLEVIDDGIGSPQWRDGPQASLGLQLVHSLTRQIDGQALCLPACRDSGEPASAAAGAGATTGPGTHWQLRFSRLQASTTHAAQA